ncbi:MAG: COR domain-containing protein [Bacteroidia bacterium]|nr:COR domain-containing protein [Bacteroidia bacterium]
MEKTTLVSHIESVLGRPLFPAPIRPHDPLGGLMAYKTDTPKYQLDETGNLIGLNLANTGLTDIRWTRIGDHPDWNDETLQALNLSDNEITGFELSVNATQLRYLNLSDNKPLTTVRLRGLMHQLVRLDVQDAALTELVLPAGLDSLEVLTAGGNQLEEFVLQADCPRLWLLDISRNQLTNIWLPDRCDALRYLYLRNNQLQTLNLTGRWEALQVLDLRHNQLQSLPDQLLDMSALRELYLFGNNSLTDVSAEVISSDENGNSYETVIPVLRSRRKSDAARLFEAKMVLVGNGGSGKTSIRIKLLDESAPLPPPGAEGRTPGLDTAVYHVKDLAPALTGLSEPVDFKLNIWDFGGQGRYREVQQLFCSRKSLYLFVTAHDDLPTAEEYVGFEYWLSMVNAFAYDEADNSTSPVIYVVNKIDQEEKLVQEETVKQSFSNIARFVRISCEKLTNFDQLREAIEQTLPRVSKDIFHTPYTVNWLNVKADLELIQQRGRHHIPLGEYLEVASRFNLDEQEAHAWLVILDRIGAVIYVGRDSALRDMVILNPAWIKDAMYKVIDSSLLQDENGALKPSHFNIVWPGYTPDEHQKLLHLLLAYRMAYEHQDRFGKVSYIIPALLPTQTPTLPAHLQHPDFVIRFEYAPFLPPGTLNRLIVWVKSGLAAKPADTSERTEIEISNDLMWRGNAVLYEPALKTHAHVWENWDEKWIGVKLFGNEPWKMYHILTRLLADIAQELKQSRYIHRVDFVPMIYRKGKWKKLNDLMDENINPFQVEPTDNTSPMHPIESLIAQGRVSEALDELLKIAPDTERNTVLSLKTRLSELEGKKRRGVIASSEEGMERNQIVDSALSTLRLILNRPNTPPAGPPADPVQVPASSPTSEKAPEKILFLAASPVDEAQLQTDIEFKAIRQRLKAATQRDLYELLMPEIRLRIEELVQAMNQKPQIVHFAGHGIAAGIMIENDQQEAMAMPLPSIRRLFRQHQDAVRLVILNACYSADQAAEISKLGIYVIGMNAPVGDMAAISFAEGIYLGLGAGKSVEKAYDDAMIIIEAKHPAFAGVPEVWKDGQKLAL